MADRFQNRGRRYRLHYLAGHSELFGDPCKPETPAQKRLREETQRAGGLPKPQKRVQHERLEMEKLALLVDYGRGENPAGLFIQAFTEMMQNVPNRPLSMIGQSVFRCTFAGSRPHP